MMFVPDETFDTFMFFIKIFIYFLFSFVCQLLVFPIFIFRPGNIDNVAISARLARFLTPVLGLKYELEGKEHLAKYKSYIVVANHQTTFDVFGMAAVAPCVKHCAIVAKKGIRWYAFTGILAWLSGFTLVERRYCQETKEKLDKILAKVKRDNCKIWFFPEGYCRNTGEIHPFRKGAFHFAIKAKIPIVPIVFSQSKWFDLDKKKFFSGTTILRALPPVITENYTIDKIEELMVKVRDPMVTHFKQLQKII